ncbi:MAG: M67 family metallopeptidase, partial [Acidimicrobiales bacterium]
VEALRRHGEADYPDEACGLIGGLRDGGARDAVVILPVANARRSRRRYLIAPRSFDRAQATLDRDGLEVVGVYHSHPDHPARPSAYDVANAWPCLSYVIVSVARGAARDVRSWVLADDRASFVEELLQWQSPS